ncbi:MAG: aspartate kinase, partial [Desulfovibrionales bacterium]|nr:aspartate kinase [Desulfovibrionales bacterium]
NMLIQGIEKALADESSVGKTLAGLRAHHESLIADLIQNKPAATALMGELDPIFKRLERYYYGIAFTREATPRMQDMVASFGERISAIILVAAVNSRGAKAILGLPEEMGIISDGKFMDASARLDPTRKNLTAYLKTHMTPDTVLFVPGFYGICEKKEITTFGRGGSDYSAAVVAAATSATVLEIWKDTEGFMTADPDNIPHCRLIPTLTYEEAAELAYTGAGILHPRTVEPVKRAGIAIAIKNTFNPDAPGSLISEKAVTANKVVKSVSYTTDVSILKIHGPGVGARPGLLSLIAGALGEKQINIKSVVTSQTCISRLLGKKELEGAKAALEGIDPSPFTALSSRDQVALVSIVGDGLHQHHGIAATCFSAVSGADVNIEMISFGTSEAALYFLVDKKRLDPTIRALHGAFFD